MHESKQRRDQIRPVRVDISAQFVSLVAAVVVQFAQTAVIVGVLGATGLGEWVFAISMTSAVALLDLGLCGTASTEATRLYGLGLRSAAQSVVSGAATVIAFILSVLVVVAVGLWFWAIPFTVGATSARAQVVSSALLYAGLGVSTTVVEGAFRASGRYGEGTLRIAGIRVFELLVASAVLFLNSDLRSFGAALVVARVAGLSWLLRTLWDGQDALLPVPGLKAVTALRGLTRPAVSFQAFQIGNIALGQLVNVLVGAALGPSALAALAVVRALTNLIRQATAAVINGTMPHVTRALAVFDSDRVKSLVRRDYEWALGLALLSTVALVSAGPVVIETWTQGAVHADRGLLICMGISTGLDVFWAVPLSVVTAANRQSRLAVRFLLSCAVSVLAVAWLLPQMALLAVPFGLLGVDFLFIRAARVQAHELILLKNDKGNPA